jgi:nitrogen regulatory protein P-II 1
MKRIEAIVRTGRLDEIVNRLSLIGITGMTVAEAHGLSPSTAHSSVFHGHRRETLLAPRYQLTIVVADSDAAHVANAILRAARTEEHGDGIVIVEDVLGVMRVRTGETDADAI